MFSHNPLLSPISVSSLSFLSLMTHALFPLTETLSFSSLACMVVIVAIAWSVRSACPKLFPLYSCSVLPVFPQTLSTRKLPRVLTLLIWSHILLVGHALVGPDISTCSLLCHPSPITTRPDDSLYDSRNRRVVAVHPSTGPLATPNLLPKTYTRVPTVN